MGVDYVKSRLQKKELNSKREIPEEKSGITRARNKHTPPGRVKASNRRSVV